MILEQTFSRILKNPKIRAKIIGYCKMTPDENKTKQNQTQTQKQKQTNKTNN